MTLIVNIILDYRPSQRSRCMLLRSIGYQLGSSMTLWDSCLNSIGRGRFCLVPEFGSKAVPSYPLLVALVSGLSEDIFFDPYSLSLEMLLRRFCYYSLLAQYSCFFSHGSRQHRTRNFHPVTIVVIIFLLELIMMFILAVIPLILPSYT
jgi:hypothetical protein